MSAADAKHPSPPTTNDDGTPAAEATRVLMLCVGNSCRSQMARGFLNCYAKLVQRALLVESGGTAPTGTIHPLAITVMREKGINIAQQPIQRIQTTDFPRFTHVFGMGCSDQACALVPRKFRGAHADWGLEDPAAAAVAGKSEDEVLAVFRRVRDAIEQHVIRFLREQAGVPVWPPTVRKTVDVSHTTTAEEVEPLTPLHPVATGLCEDCVGNGCSAATTAMAAGVEGLFIIAAPAQPAAAAKLGFLDRYLTLWILLAMVLGVIIGAAAPGAVESFNNALVTSDGTNIPIAIGLIAMMFPPLTRVKYEVFARFVCAPCLAAGTRRQTTASEAEADTEAEPATPIPLSRDDGDAAAVSGVGLQNYEQRRAMLRSTLSALSLSVVLNWVVGPLVMFVLAIATLPDHFEYLRGIVLVGLARCIAMVIVWNTLAQGDADLCALSVGLNSVLQIALFSAYAYLFVGILPQHLGLDPTAASSGPIVSISIGTVAQSVAIYLGVPFVAGALTRYLVIRHKGRAWFEQRLTPVLSPVTLVALLYTIVALFAMKGALIVQLPLDILRIAMPLCLYFFAMFAVSVALAKVWPKLLAAISRCCCSGAGATAQPLSHAQIVTVAFTAASNNFELAIAIAIAVFGLQSGEALAAVVGPLVEVPVMLGFVHFVRFAKRRDYF